MLKSLVQILHSFEYRIAPSYLPRIIQLGFKRDQLQLSGLLVRRLKETKQSVVRIENNNSVTHVFSFLSLELFRLRFAPFERNYPLPETLKR